MSLQKRHKLGIIGAVAVVVAAGVIVGANYGKTQTAIDPSSFGTSTPAGESVSTPSPSPTGTAAAAAESGAPAPELVVLRTSTKKNCTSTPYVVAERKGFFEAEGLKIEYTGELASNLTLPAVLNGTNDFEGALPNSLATYISEGADIKAVTMSVVDPPSEVDPKFRHMRFYVSPDIGVKTLEELKTYKEGKNLTISGRVPTCSSFIPNAIFDNHGLDRERLEYIAFDSDTAAIQAVQQGNLDIAGVHPPFYHLAEESGLVLLADSYDSGLGPAAGVSVYYFTEDFIDSNPDAVQRFVNAVKKAQEWANGHEEEAIELTAEYIGKEVTAVHYYYTSPGFPKEYIQPWIDDLVVEGTLKKDQLTVEDLITTKFQ